jgi:uncharacterized protein YbjT (DUF2867 family)
MSRNVCVTAVDGNTGFAIAELLLTNEDFSSKIGSVVGLSLKPSDPNCKSLAKLGATIVPHKPGRVKDMVETLQETEADTICVIPPADKNKFDITYELIEATKKANIPNVLLLSSAGADLADERKQPRLKEFLKIEELILATKGDPKTKAGHSPVVIRAGFYAENLLQYAPQAQREQTIPLPVGNDHKLAPIALGDVAQAAAFVLSSEGKNGFDDKYRGQLIVLTGPALVSGSEIAAEASSALGVQMKFEDISHAEAKRVLASQSDSDDSEKQYLLEYYSLVREGKTNYISTLAFHDITGTHPQELPDFFKSYEQEFRPHHHHTPNKKRKIDGK